MCGSPASRTQRLINGEPAGYEDPIILIGATEAYEPRCRHHHEVPAGVTHQTSLVYSDEVNRDCPFSFRTS